MAKRIFAIAFIFVCTSIAWVALGSTIFARTRGSDQRLRGRVGSTWGTTQAQQAPVAYTERIETRVVFKGFTGLAITIGSILTLFAAMQLTGRVRWSEVFAAGPPQGTHQARPRVTEADQR